MTHRASSLPILLLLVACGGKTEEPVQAAPEPAPAPLDCRGFTDKLVACADAFEAAYAKTEAAGIAGEGDGAVGAKRLVDGYRGTLRDHLEQTQCVQQWNQSRGSWRQRFESCDLSADCDTWAACAAPAVGDPAP